MTVFLSPIVGVADTSPEGGSKKSFRKLFPEGGSKKSFRKLFPEGGSEFCFIVFASVAKQSPGRVEVYGVYSPYFFRGIAAVATLLRNDGKAIVRWDISLALNIGVKPK